MTHFAITSLLSLQTVATVTLSTHSAFDPAAPSGVCSIQREGEDQYLGGGSVPSVPGVGKESTSADALPIPRVDYETYLGLRNQIERLDREGHAGKWTTVDIHATADVPGMNPLYVNEIVTRGPDVSVTTKPVRWAESGGIGFWIPTSLHEEIEGYQIFSGRGLRDHTAGGFVVKSRDRAFVKAIHDQLVLRARRLGAVDLAREEVMGALEDQDRNLIQWTG